MRFCAAEALDRLTDREHAFFDWLHAPAAQRTREAEAWFGWLVRQR